MVYTSIHPSLLYTLFLQHSGLFSVVVWRELFNGPSGETRAGVFYTPCCFYDIYSCQTVYQTMWLPFYWLFTVIANLDPLFLDCIFFIMLLCVKQKQCCHTVSNSSAQQTVKRTFKFMSYKTKYTFKKKRFSVLKIFNNWILNKC